MVATGPTIAAALIVRDEAACLAGCLESIGMVADEIVVADTGSQDDSPAVARQYTDRVLSFSWQDDFSAARNFVLDHVTADYVLTIDADETVEDPAQARERLHAFIRENDESVTGTVAIVSPFGGQAGHQVSVTDTERFFRRDRFHYEGPVHEQIVSRTGEMHARVSTGIRLFHSGYQLDATTANRKVGRNRRMLERVLADTPDDEYYLYQLGKSHFSADDSAAAVEAFERAVSAIAFTPGQPPLGRRGPVSETVLTDLIVSLAYAYVNTGAVNRARDLLEAHQALGHAGTLGPDLPHALGYVYLMQGNVERAREAYEESLRRGSVRELVLGTGSYSSHYHLGLLREAEQDVQAGLQHYAQALAAKPDYPAALGRCVDLIVEYRAILPAALWDLVDREAFVRIYKGKARAHLARNETDKVALLLEAAKALAPELATACADALRNAVNGEADDVSGE